MKNFLTLSLAVALVAACGVTYKSKAEDFARTQPESAWGSRPPTGHQKAEEGWIRSQLKDPYSADVRPGPVGRFVLPASFTDPTVVPVWCSDINVNAKNSFGAFTGFKAWRFCYSNGNLFAVENSEGIRSWVGQSDSYTGLQGAVNSLRR